MTREYSQARTRNELLEVKVTEESALVARSLGNIRPGTQASADFFNEHLPLRHPARVSRQTVWNWANGVHKPSERVLLAWRIFYRADDPRYKLAAALTKAREKAAAHWVKTGTFAPVEMAGEKC